MDAVDIIGLERIPMKDIRVVQLGELILAVFHDETVLLKVVETENGCTGCYYRHSSNCPAWACGASFKFIKIS